MSWMKCTCGRKALLKKGLKFNGHPIKGWICKKCGVIAYDPIETERILLLNKLKKKKFYITLNQIRSNLIVRIPKNVSDVLGLKNGKKIEFGLNSENEMIMKAKN